MCLTCLNVYTLKTFGWADILTLVCVVFTVSEGTAATVYSDPCLCKKQRVPYLLEEVIWTLILRPLIVGGLCGAWPGIQLRSRPLSTAFWPALICHPTECRSSGMAIGWGGGGQTAAVAPPTPKPLQTGSWISWQIRWIFRLHGEVWVHTLLDDSVATPCGNATDMT